MNFQKRSKNIFILIFISFISIVIYIVTSYETISNKNEFISYNLNTMLYNSYLKSKKENYKFETNSDVIEYYIYDKNKSRDFKCNKKINNRFSESFIKSDSCSIIYDNKLGKYSLLYINLPTEYNKLEITYVILSFGFLASIIYLLYRRYNNVFINQKVIETVNLFRDTSFIVSNFNHEINTPLTSIEASLYLLLQENNKCYTKNMNCKKLERINNIINSISDDIRFIKLFISKINTMKMINGKDENSINLFETLQVIKNTVSNITTTKMEVSIDEKFRNKKINFSTEYLYSIFINLIKNSYESDATYTNIYLGNINNNKISIIYKDNGSGIKIKPATDIFKKNISSKKNNRGFGMYFIKTILSEYNCDIIIVQSNKHGTEFSIELPIHKG